MRRSSPKLLCIRVSDRGPGIADVIATPEWSIPSAAQRMGVGLGRRAPADGPASRSSRRRRRHHGSDGAAHPARGIGPADARGARRDRREAAGLAHRSDGGVARTEPRDHRQPRAPERARGRDRALEPRAGGDQPRRGRAVFRARARRPTSCAAPSEHEVALPLQHEPRVPHAAELDPRAGAPADRRHRRPV
mgnify:CR=1 FL=1